MLWKQFLLAWVMVVAGFGAQNSPNRGAQSSGAPTKDQGPSYTVASITFENVTQLSTAQQDEIASDIKSRSYHGNDWLDEVDERLRNAWQGHGYFGAEVHSNAHRSNDDEHDQQFEVVTNIDEGRKYLLAEIQWSGILLFQKEELDEAMPIKRLDSFDTAKIRAGLENLRKLYFTKGYLHFVGIPDTEINDADATITLKLDLQPGEVYHVGQVSFAGGNAELRKKVRRKWPLHPGDPFNPEMIGKFFAAKPPVMPGYASVDQNVEQSVSEENHTVDLVVHLEKR